MKRPEAWSRAAAAAGEELRFIFETSPHKFRGLFGIQHNYFRCLINIARGYW
jgi:hypothetical protein